MFVRSLSDSEACHPFVFNLCELWVPHAVMLAGTVKVTRGRLGKPEVRARFFLPQGGPEPPSPGQAARAVALNPLVSLGLAWPGGWSPACSEACKVQRWLGQNGEREGTRPWAWSAGGPAHFEPPARTRPKLLGSNSVGVSPAPGEAIGSPVITKSVARSRRKGTSRRDPLALWSLSCPLRIYCLLSQGPPPTPGPQV